MITRKEAKQVIETWEKYQNLGNLTIDEFLSQFGDEPTPDQMLDEMWRWAKDHDYHFRYTHSIGGGKELEFTLFMKFYPEKLFCCGSTRDATITEAYRQFKEVTK